MSTMMEKISNFKEKCNKNLSKFKENKVEINENDSLLEKALIAFLQDLMKAFKNENQSNEMDMLKKLIKENQQLTDEKLLATIKNELKNNEFLSTAQKDGVMNFIDKNENFMTKLVGNKFEEITNIQNQCKELGMGNAQIQEKLKGISFAGKDVQNAVISSQKEVAKEAIKEGVGVIRKAVLKV